MRSLVNTHLAFNKKTKKHLSIRLFVGATLLVIGALSVLTPPSAQAAACQMPGTNFGSASTTITVPTATTYRIWSRVMAPNSTNNSYLLEVDGQQCYVVGGASMTANSWTWIAYKDGNPNAKIDLALTAGTHTLKFIGNKQDVKLDRVIFAADLNCIPTGNGNNCDTPSDTTPPTADLTAPAEGSMVSGTVEMAASASDNTSVTKVEFYVNSALVATDTSAPYTYAWNTAASGNGQKTITAKAYDPAGNFGSDSYRVTVQNGDSQAPTTPTDVVAQATSPTAINVAWAASTDNVGVVGYLISRNGAPLTQVAGNTLSLRDSTLSPNTQYTYTVSAVDAAGNRSPVSAVASAKTPPLPDTEAPTTPADLSARAASATQINLNWRQSTDNSGSVVYDIYRVLVNGTTEKIHSTPANSFGVTNLRPNTDYTFMVKARDAAGNESSASNNANAKTAAESSTSRSIIWGVVRDSNGRRLKNVTVEAISTTSGKRYVYKTGLRGTYSFRNLPAGRYNLAFKADGYKTKNSSLKVNGKNIKQRDMSLSKRNTNR